MISKVRIGNRQVGPGEPTYVIAEAGSNHDQDLRVAKKLIEVAAQADVDAVKFQLFRAELLYPSPGLVHDTVKAAELNRAWLPELAQTAREHGLDFLASPFDAEAVDLLAELGVPAIKWASSETTNLPLLRHAAQRHRPLLLSTGMCDLADVHEAIETCRAAGNDQLVLLQCTSLYPAEPRHAHIRAMDALREAFQVPVGFSDHTFGISVPIAAVARGACLVEKHFTLGRNRTGPDHSYALEPHELKDMVVGIRAAEQAMGDAWKRMLPEEAEAARRTCLRAAKPIQAGEVITADKLVEQRPAKAGIRPRYRSILLGARARVSIARGEAIEWSKLELP